MSELLPLMFASSKIFSRGSSAGFASGSLSSVVSEDVSEDSKSLLVSTESASLDDLRIDVGRDVEWCDVL